jgi:SAM-dependent methyltransferase
MRKTAKRICKGLVLAALRRSLPLATRMRIVCWARRGSLRSRLFNPVELLSDLAGSDPNRLHRFLWSNHLTYAASYEVARFGPERLEVSRRILLTDIEEHLRQRSIAPECDVASVFEAGCSLGYVLRYAETKVFPCAARFTGVDVDKYAIEEGSAHLRGMQSKVRLITGEVTDLDHIIGDQQYDVVLCCGVLLYFDEPTAAQIVKTLLRHTRFVLGLISLAHPVKDNGTLERSEVRPADHGFIHNLDAMISAAGGKLVSRRWMPQPPSADVSPPYFALAEPRYPSGSKRVA